LEGGDLPVSRQEEEEGTKIIEKAADMKRVRVDPRSIKKV